MNAPLKNSTPQKKPAPRQRAKEQTRKALLKSALSLYSEHGALGISMNKVAKGAGIAQPSFYNHYPNLEALLEELRLQLKKNYMGPISAAVLSMLKDYDVLSTDQFKQQNRHCLELIFKASFQDIRLFQHIMQDRPRFESTSALGFGGLLIELQEEWSEVIIQGLELSGRTFNLSTVHLCLDSASAQIHELILGCHEGRYNQEQAINVLSNNLTSLFVDLFSNPH
jgi:TetR/AcrR family transcriptional regulator of autoinduction and epiphytic fitness